MKIKNKLYKEISPQVPNVCEKIKSNINWEEIKAKSTKTTKKSSLRITALCACVIVFCLMLVLPISLITTEQTGYYLIIDVNPCIRLTVDKNDNVVEQKGLNEDGIIFLFKENYVGINVNLANNAIFDKFNKQGLLSGDIGIGICHFDGSSYVKKQANLSDNIEAYLKNLGNFDLKVLTENDFENIKNYYEDSNVSDYEICIVNDFKDKIKEVVEEKIFDLQSLLTKLEKYKEEIEDFIEFFEYKEEIMLFVNKYNYELEFNFDNVRYCDIEEFCEDLRENLEELTEALGSLNENADESDFEDLLEDLFDLVEEELYKKN